MRHTVN